VSRPPRACARDFFLPSIALDRRSTTSLHEQVSRQIERPIGNGVPAGSRLPSSRVMARLLGVSRNTVMVAYDQLVSAGLIRGRRGAGMVVAAPGTIGLHMLDPQGVLRQAQYPARRFTSSIRTARSCTSPFAEGDMAIPL
jgi:DNA-binding GntR family transcriptional regulator